MEPQVEPKDEVRKRQVGAVGVWGRMMPEALMERLLEERGVPRGRKSRKVSDGSVVGAIVMRQLRGVGGLAAGGALLDNAPMSEAAYSQRRADLPVGLFDRLCGLTLGPIAEERHEPEAFLEGQRLVAIDGTTFQMVNTEAITRVVPKRKSSQGESAFPLLQVVGAVELATYAPMAVKVSTDRSEVAMLEELVEGLSDRILVIADRGFGTAKSVDRLQRHLRSKGSDFLLRVRANLRVEVAEVLADGSCLVEMPLYEPDAPGMVKEVLRVRELQLTLITREGKQVPLRFWTSLLDPETHPAEVLGELYAWRWEIEGYYRNLKNFVHDGTLLESQTPETAIQDAYCIVLASHLEARARQEAARATGTKLKLLSLAKTIDLITGFWQFCLLAQDMLDDNQIRSLHERLYAQIARFCKTQKRRERTCQRAKRQTSSDFPKLKKRTYTKGKTTISKAKKLA